MLLRETIESVLAQPLEFLPAKREVARLVELPWPPGHALVLTGLTDGVSAARGISGCLAGRS